MKPILVSSELNQFKTILINLISELSCSNISKPIALQSYLSALYFLKPTVNPKNGVLFSDLFVKAAQVFAKPELSNLSSDNTKLSMRKLFDDVVVASTNSDMTKANTLSHTRNSGYSLDNGYINLYLDKSCLSIGSILSVNDRLSAKDGTKDPALDGSRFENSEIDDRTTLQKVIVILPRTERESFEVYFRSLSGAIVQYLLCDRFNGVSDGEGCESGYDRPAKKRNILVALGSDGSLKAFGGDSLTGGSTVTMGVSTVTTGDSTVTIESFIRGLSEVAAVESVSDNRLVEVVQAALKDLSQLAVGLSENTSLERKLVSTDLWHSPFAFTKANHSRLIDILNAQFKGVLPGLNGFRLMSDRILQGTKVFPLVPLSRKLVEATSDDRLLDLVVLLASERSNSDIDCLSFIADNRESLRYKAKKFSERVDLLEGSTSVQERKEDLRKDSWEFSIPRDIAVALDDLQSHNLFKDTILSSLYLERAIVFGEVPQFISCMDRLLTACNRLFNLRKLRVNSDESLEYLSNLGASLRVVFSAI